MYRPTNILAAIAASLAAGFAGAATITVTTTTDRIQIDGQCSLREAIQASNLNMAIDSCAAGNGHADSIALPNGTYTMALAGVGEDNNATGDFDILDGLEILPSASLHADVTIDANGLDRVFEVHPGASLELSNLTITGGAVNPGFGGCIYAEGTLRVDQSIVSDCSAVNGGGIAIWNGGSLELTRSRVNLNSAESLGGGVFDFQSSEPCVITESTVSGNGATSGGGIHVRQLQLVDSTVSGNFAGEDGGGIRWPSDSAHLSTLVNSTISGNFAGNDGGGLYCDGMGHTELSNMTITNNTADSNGDDNGGGGGVAVVGSVSLRLQNSVVAANRDSSIGADPELSPDCTGAITSWGYNLFGIAETGVCDVSASDGDLIGTPAAPIDPVLGALGANGGATETHLPETTSPVVDMGNPAGCTDQDGVTLTSDQRGTNRHADGPDPGLDTTCDMGSVEVQYSNPSDIFSDGFESGSVNNWSENVN